MAAFVAVLVAGAMPAHSPVPAETQTPMTSILDDPRVQELGRIGLDHLYGMRRDEAINAFNAIEELYPEHPIGPFLRGLTIWWDIMVELPKNVHDDAFFKEMDVVVSRANRMLKRNRKDFDAMFFKGAALGFSGRLKSNRGRWLKAAVDGKTSLDYIMAIAEREDDNADFGFGRGIYDYFAVAIPESYPGVKPLMILMPRGNKERGLRRLERTMNEGHFIRTESAYFLLQIYYGYERDFRKSLEYVQWLREQHPANSFFHAFEGRVYARWGRYRSANQIFADVMEKYDAGEAGYSDSIAEQSLYYLVRGNMAYRYYDEAQENLDRLVSIYDGEGEPSGFHMLGILRLGMVNDATGNREDALAYYNKVLTMNDWSGAHERARRYIETPYAG